MANNSITEYYFIRSKDDQRYVHSAIVLIAYIIPVLLPCLKEGFEKARKFTKQRAESIVQKNSWRYNLEIISEKELLETQSNGIVCSKI